MKSITNNRTDNKRKAKENQQEKIKNDSNAAQKRVSRIPQDT